MKIQRYIAKDMRSALAQVRDALGADAVILSSGRVGDEVEVVAAVDFEAVQQAAAQAVTAPRQRSVRDVREDSRPDTTEVRPDPRFAARAETRAAAPRTPAAQYSEVSEET